MDTTTPTTKITSTEFCRLYPYDGDLPLDDFPDEDTAHRYADEYNLCVYDPHTYACVFCSREDH